MVEFDPVEQEYDLEQNRSQLEEAEQQIKKMQADIAVRKAQDNVSRCCRREIQHAPCRAARQGE